MASLAKAMKPGVILTVVDFERIEGLTTDWIMGDVGASKEVCQKEIEDSGLTRVEKVKIDGVKENYEQRFKRRQDPGALLTKHGS